MPENSKPRRIRRTNKDLRQDIINAATELIEENGFADASLMRIVKKAKIEAIVFHRHFGNLDEFMDEYVRQYDYWFSDIVDSCDSELYSRKGYRNIIHGLFDDLSGNVIMQRLLKWELSSDNPTTRRTADLREHHTMPLTRNFQQVFSDTDFDIEAVSALIIGGIYYLVLHRDMATFSGIDVGETEGKQKIHRAIDSLSDMFFSRLQERRQKRQMVLRMKEVGLSDDQIAYVLKIPVEELLVNNANPES